MNRWLHKLTKKEIWQLHQDVLQSNGVRGGRMRKTLRLLDWIVRQEVDGHDEDI